MDDNINPADTPPKYGKAYLVFHNSSPGVWSWTVAGWLSGGWQRQKTGEPIDADRVFCYRDLPPSPVFPDDFLNCENWSSPSSAQPRTLPQVVGSQLRRTKKR